MPLPRGGHLCREVPCVERRRPLCREEAPLPNAAEGIEGGLYAAERRPCAAERRPLCRREEALVPPRGGPCAAERRPLCREEALGAERYSVLRGLEEAPVSGGGSCAERRPSVLVGPVLCAERI